MVLISTIMSARAQPRMKGLAGFQAYRGSTSDAAYEDPAERRE